MKAIRDRLLTVVAAVALAGGIGLATAGQTATADPPAAAPHGAAGYGVDSAGYAAAGGAAFSPGGGFATVTCWSCVIDSFSPGSTA